MNLDNQNWIDSIEFRTHLMNILLLLGGIVLFYFPPKKINVLYGYRTNRSMKSQDSWDFSQRFAAVKMIQFSIASIAISLFIAMLPTPFVLKNISPIITGIFGLILALYFTEKQLKKKF